jgi:hypothetical protein
MSVAGLGANNHCAGEGQKQFARPTQSRSGLCGEQENLCSSLELNPGSPVVKPGRASVLTERLRLLHPEIWKTSLNKQILFDLIHL